MSNTPDNEEASAQTQTLESPQPGQPVLSTAKSDGNDSNDKADESSNAAPIRKVDPMQGMKLEAILQELVAYFGWDEMGYRINIRCFNEDPSIGSSLKFLRKTPWARKKVDTLFLTMRAEQVERSG
jgi:DNA-binding protein VF530